MTEQNDADSSVLKLTTQVLNEEDVDMTALDATGNLSMQKVMSRKEVD